MGKDTVVSQFHWGVIRKDYLVVVQAGDQYSYKYIVILQPRRWQIYRVRAGRNKVKARRDVQLTSCGKKGDPFGNRIEGRMSLQEWEKIR